MVRYAPLLVAAGLLLAGAARADEPRNQGQSQADCAHQANARNLIGQARADFVNWCTATAARVGERDISTRSDRYQKCNDGAKRRGLKGDERDGFMDWCTNRTPDRVSDNYFEAYKGCYAKATDRGFHDADRRDYIERCIEGGRNVDSNLWQSYQQCFATADDRKLGGEAREDFVNRCVSRGDQTAYEKATAETRTCSQRGRTSLKLTGRDYDRFMAWCLNPYSDKDDYARRWQVDKRCYETADARSLKGDPRRDYLEQCLGYGKYSFNN
jgi:hypothetical protein